MVREDIVGGLKEALSRGEHLKRAMTTFLNAGYKKQDIEEAARFLMQEHQMQTSQIAPQPSAVAPSVKPEPKHLPLVPIPSSAVTKPIPQQVIQPVQKPQPPAQTVSEFQPRPQLTTPPAQKQMVSPPLPPVPVQRVSEYVSSSENQAKDKIILGILFLILLVLLGLLASAFLFKDELINFINNLFGV